MKQTRGIKSSRKTIAIGYALIVLLMLLASYIVICRDATRIRHYRTETDRLIKRLKHSLQLKGPKIKLGEIECSQIKTYDGSFILREQITILQNTYRERKIISRQF